LFVTVLVVIAPLLEVFAACPNACSGHGTCGDYDSCNCYSNWMGGDCSRRVCMYNWAWVTSAQGDLNFDGDTYDGTSYSDSYYFTSGAVYLQTDAAPGGTWEMWPSTHSQTYDEGHFYMECSNRGLCDRKTGLCQCFEGYTGGACRRSACPNSCSGHGLCKTVNQLLTEYNTANGVNRKYNLWDGDMARTCVCDPGFTGADCSEKYCPHGDDPLTRTHQVDEVQWIEVRSECTAGCTGSLGGTATFTYTDHFGQEWTTDPIAIQHYDGTTAADQMATDLQNALKALPNDIIPDVSVTAGYCETILPGKFSGYVASAASGDNYNAGTNPASGYLRCPANLGGGLIAKDLVVGAADGLVYINGFTGENPATYVTLGTTVDATGVADADVTCNYIQYEECVRFKVVFTANPGPITQLAVDDTLVTRNSQTQDQNALNLINSVAMDTLTIVDDSTATFAYTDTVASEVYSTDDQGTITVATKTITFGTASTAGVTFPINSKIELLCTTSGVERSLGTYTVAATSTGGAALTVVEAIIADNAPCANAGDGTVKVKTVTHFIDTNVDLTQENLAGLVVEVSTFSEATQTTVDTVQYPAAGTGQIFLSSTSGLSTTVASGAGVLTLNGVGTKENSECGDRGLCNRETGICKCFKGYTGESCSVQSALVA